MGLWSNIVGTLENTFRVGRNKATLDASGLTGERTLILPDANVPLAGVAGQLGGTGASPDVRGLRETGGPTLLTLGSIADGEFLRRSGTAAIGAVPAPLDGKYLTWDADSVLTNERRLVHGDGIAWAYSTPGSTYTLSGRGWNKIGLQTVASNSATVEFTGLQGGTSYIGYCVVCCHVAPATDNVVFRLRTSTNNGSSYDSGASDYAWANYGLNTGGTSIVTGDNSDSEVQLTGDSVVGNASNEHFNGNVIIYNPTASQQCHVTTQNSFVNHNGLLITTIGNGRRLSTTAVNAIQFSFASGNIASGTFDLYGLAY